MPAHSRVGLDTRPPVISEGDVFLGTEVGEPAPGAGAFDGDDDVFSEGSNGLEKGIGPSGYVPVEPDVAVLVEDA